MLRKEFIAGMVTGAIAFGGTGAAAAGLMAQPSMQGIFVNGRPVYCTAYAISGNNYVRLRDIGQAVGFGVSYDASTDSVQISTSTQQAVQTAVATAPTAPSRPAAPQPATTAPTQPTVSPASQDYSQSANPEIFTADLTREFYNSARHAYLNAEKMAAAYDSDRHMGDESLAVRLPSGTAMTTKMKNVCSELSGVFYNYSATEKSPYVYAYPRTDADLEWSYVQEIIETAKSFNSDRETAEYLAETICGRLEYAYNRNDIRSWSKSMESGGKAVCSGYSAAFQRIGRAAGLQVLTVGSTAGNHAWNNVYCDGEWLVVDLTHYDTSHNEVYWFQSEHPKMRPDGIDEINFAKEVDAARFYEIINHSSGEPSENPVAFLCAAFRKENFCEA